MAATMINMKLVKADTLTIDSLEVGDLIKYDNDIVEVLSIKSDKTGDVYDIEIVNDFGESEVVQFLYNDLVEWFVYLND